jgi:hypothetical protein
VPSPAGLGSIWCVAAQGSRTRFASPNGEQRGRLHLCWLVALGAFARGACGGVDREILARGGQEGA